MKILNHFLVDNSKITLQYSTASMEFLGLKTLLCIIETNTDYK